MDSTEVAMRITEAVMAKSTLPRAIKTEELAETYVKTFTDVFKRVNAVMNSVPAAPAPPPTPRATSEIFPLTHER